MEFITLFFNSFVIGFSGAMMPGPLLAVDIAETPRHGWKTGPVITIGHAIAEIGVVLLLALGVAAIAGQTTVTRGIAIVGGLALLAMAAMMVWDTLKGKVSYHGKAQSTTRAIGLTGKGITTTLINPYWFVWWGTIGLALVVQSKELGLFGPIVFYFGHILSDFVWYTVVSIALWRGRRLMVGTGLKALLLGCALFLLYLGGKFIYDGLTGGV